MYLVDWKGFLPAGEHILAGQLKAGYPRIPAQAGGYPPAVAVAGADEASP
jgi:hypothetical protein